MHEVSLCESILTQIEHTMKNYPDQKLLSVTLGIGALQLVVPESLDFAFSSLTKDTHFEHVQLHQNTIAARGLCLSCQQEGERKSLYDLCPHCGSYNIKMLSGMEIIIEKMELSHVQK